MLAAVAALVAAEEVTTIREALVLVLLRIHLAIRLIFPADRIAEAAEVADIIMDLPITMAVAMVGQMEATVKALQLEGLLAIDHTAAATEEGKADTAVLMAATRRSTEAEAAEAAMTDRMTLPGLAAQATRA